MQIVTIRGPNLAQLMDSMRKDFGADAVLLSVRRIEERSRDGQRSCIEGTIAIENQRKPVEVESHEERISPEPLRKIQPAVAAQNCSDLEGIEAIELIGPMGSGKTTTAAKIAGLLQRTRKTPVGLISTDVERPGGSALLTAFAQELQVSMTTAATASDLQNRLSRWNFRGPLVIDTRSYSPRDGFGIDRLTTLLETVQMKKKRFLVLNAAEHPAVARECLGWANQVSLSGVILTRVDQAAGIGHCLQEVNKSGIPLAFIGTGERVPLDLRLPTTESLAALENSARAAMVG